MAARGEVLVGFPVAFPGMDSWRALCWSLFQGTRPLPDRIGRTGS
jgi:hypothetical protein